MGAASMLRAFRDAAGGAADAQQCICFRALAHPLHTTAGRAHLLRAVEVAGEVRQALRQQLSGRLQVPLQFSFRHTAAAVQSVWPIQSCHCSCYPSS